MSEDTLFLIYELIDVIISGLTNGSVYALMAVGLTLVYGVTKAFNFAYGSFFNLGGYLAWMMIPVIGMVGGYVSIFIAVIPIMFLVGYGLQEVHRNLGNPVWIVGQPRGRDRPAILKIGGNQVNDLVKCGGQGDFFRGDRGAAGVCRLEHSRI